MAAAVFVVLSMLYVGRTYYAKQQERMHNENERWKRAEEEAHRAHQDTTKAALDR